MIVDRTPLALRADDSADGVSVQDLQIRLADCLAAADRQIGAMLESLNQARDILDGRRQAKVWGVEAQQSIAIAIEAREQLARAQRSAGLMSARWAVQS